MMSKNWLGWIWFVESLLDFGSSDWILMGYDRRWPCTLHFVGLDGALETGE